MLQEYIDDFGINYAQLQDACSSGLAIKHKVITAQWNLPMWTP